MPITITFSNSDGSINQVETHDFGDDAAKQDNNIARLTAWAQASYLNEDGSEPGPNAARSRLAKGTVQGYRDGMKRYEQVEAIEALPPPEDVPV